MEWLYQSATRSGDVITVFGPTEWGWFWQVEANGERYAEGIAPTRVSCYGAVDELSREWVRSEWIDAYDLLRASTVVDG